MTCFLPNNFLHAKIFPHAGSCLETLYVIAFTSGHSHGWTISRHRIWLQYGESREQLLTLYDRPGVDFESNKGDLWTFSLSPYDCITLSSIQFVAVVANGNDGWNIESIVTLVSESAVNRIQVLTQNFGVFYWIDSDGDPFDRHFDLTLSTADVGPGIII